MHTAIENPINFARATELGEIRYFSVAEPSSLLNKISNSYLFNLIISKADQIQNNGDINSEFFFDNYLPTIFITVGEIKLDTKPIQAIYNYLDSSIWNYHLNINDISSDSDSFGNKLSQINLVIKANHENKYYHIDASREYHDFSKFLIQNKLERTGHKQIAPILFHSEEYFRIECLRILDSWRNAKISLDIGLLIVDDYADIPRYEEYDSTKTSKIVHDVIDKLIKDWNETRKVSDREQRILNISPSCVHSILEMALHSSYSDFITLDYLFQFSEIPRKEKLDNCKEVNSSNDTFKKLVSQSSFSFLTKDTQFGVSAIKVLDNKNSQLPLGPLSSYWILPNTAYPSAFDQDVVNSGVTAFNKNIRISKGASVLNTPNLFLYQLLSIIDQVKEEGIGVFLTWDVKRKEITRYLNEIETSSSTELNDKRSDWIHEFTRVSDIFSNLSVLERDKNRGSKLCESLYKYCTTDPVKAKIKILTHYRDLLYQLAFKAYKDNEYIFIEANKLRHALNLD